MTHLRKIQLVIALIGWMTVAQAQNVSMTTGGQSAVFLPKGSTQTNFTVNGNNFFITSHFEQAMTKYYLETYDGKGNNIFDGKLEIDLGVINNTYGINNVVGVSKNAWVIVEHLDKAAATNTLSARLLEEDGKVGAEEKELISMPFEKMLNSGLNHVAVSPDKNTMAVVGELPYEKETQARLKIAIFDINLKKNIEKEVNIPGEDTRNKSISVEVTNDGNVYILKRTFTKNAEIALSVYHFDPQFPEALSAENTVEFTAPTYIFNYITTTSPNNELVIAGTYYERKTVLVGDKAAVGMFYFTQKKNEKSLKTIPLNAPVENLTARKILFANNTIFLTAEQYKETKIAPPPSSTGAAAFDYSYDYTHKNEYVIGMDVQGNKKFEINMAKDFVIRDLDKQHYAAYFIVNGKLTIIYNDLSKKYGIDPSYNVVTPALVQVDENGLMSSPVIFKENLKIPYTYTLHPAAAIQQADGGISLLMKNSQNSQYVNVKVN